jgi:L-asparagine transporter-like permease
MEFLMFLVVYVSMCVHVGVGLAYVQGHKRYYIILDTKASFLLRPYMLQYICLAHIKSVWRASEKKTGKKTKEKRRNKKKNPVTITLL